MGGTSHFFSFQCTVEVVSPLLSFSAREHVGALAETLGGIPHDTYEMTSPSIRQYVLGIYKQHGLREKDVAKVQTGGPDGDLSSSTY